MMIARLSWERSPSDPESPFARVAPTGSRLYRGLAIRRVPSVASADCQSAKQQVANLRYVESPNVFRRRGTKGNPAPELLPKSSYEII